MPSNVRSDKGSARRLKGGRVAASSRPGAGPTLPLGAQLERRDNGWFIALPVRAEAVRVEKRSVVAEEVLVRVRPREDIAAVEESVRRETLRVDREGRPPDAPPVTGSAGEAALEGTQPLDIRPLQAEKAAPARAQRPRRRVP